MGIFLRKIPFCTLLCIFWSALFLSAPVWALEELKVGYVPGTGFLDEDRPGHMRGNGYEYMEFLSGFLGAKFTYIPCVSWWEAGAKLENMEIDLLPAMPGNYKTMPFAIRTDHVIARFPMELVVQDDFSGGQVRLGTLDYNYPTPSLPTIAKEHGFSYELITYNDPTAMKAAFTARQLDGYIQPLLHPEKTERVLALFDRVSYRLLLHRSRPELLARLNTAQDSLLLNQPNIRNRLNDKYERAKGFPLVLSPAEKAYLQEKKTLHVAVLMQNKPYFYRDENGNWAGATKALLTQLEHDLGIQTELVEINSAEELRRLLTRGSVDFVADVPCDFSWLDGLGLTPTQSYLEVGYVPVTRHGAATDKTARVAAVDGNFETVTFTMTLYPPEQIVSCRSWEECFSAVGSGLADVTYVPRAAVPYLIEAASAYNLSADTESVFMESLSLGAAKDADPRLWQILDKEINHLPPSLLSDALSQTAHENVHQLNPLYLLYHYPLQSTLIIFLFMGSIMGIVYYRSRSHRRQLAAMEQLAYTDSRCQLPNQLYLEHHLEHILRNIRREHDAATCFVTVFAASAPAGPHHHDRHIFAEPVKTAANLLNSKDWVAATAAGAMPGELICLCAAGSPQVMQNLAAEFAVDMTSADGSLSWHAGLCLLQGNSLTQAAENAALACQEALENNLKAKFWTNTNT